MTEKSFQSPSEQKENREELRLSLQILPSWFSADYINCFPNFEASIETWSHDFRLPEYWTYVENKLSDFYPNPEESVWEILKLSAMYYQWITDESLEAFNGGIREINALIASRVSRDTIKEQADMFMEKFLNNKYMWENPQRLLDILDRVKQQGI